MNEIENVDRTCATCACSKIESVPTRPNEKQMFCRRNSAFAAEMRVEVPRIGRDGKPVIRDGKPVMEAGKANMFLYPPTDARLTCFDGWRPIGTLPGDRWEMAAAMLPIMEAMKRLHWDMIKDASAETFPPVDWNRKRD